MSKATLTYNPIICQVNLGLSVDIYLQRFGKQNISNNNWYAHVLFSSKHKLSNTLWEFHKSKRQFYL